MCLSSAAGAALTFVLGPRELTTLQPIEWSAVGKTIWEPSLRSLLKTHGGRLGSMVVEDVRPGNTFFVMLGTKLVAPGEDEVLTEDRVERAIQLLTAAIAIALIDDGWQIEALPGQPIGLRREEHTFEPRIALRKLADEQMTVADWCATCDAVGLAGRRLAYTPRVEVSVRA